MIEQDIIAYPYIIHRAGPWYVECIHNDPSLPGDGELGHTVAIGRVMVDGSIMDLRRTIYISDGMVDDVAMMYCREADGYAADATHEDTALRQADMQPHPPLLEDPKAQPDADGKVLLGHHSGQAFVEWPDGIRIRVRLRVHDGLPSYDPTSLPAGPDIIAQAGAWGDNPRAMSITRAGHTSILLQWEYHQRAGLRYWVLPVA